jgi:hypothetical protein
MLADVNAHPRNDCRRDAQRVAMLGMRGCRRMCAS